ncbi:MAG TPA: chemotaxis protein CheW [Thermoanaerobaculia bacterium]|nr:chemotaxis protein CheW [Thermoanaerobaculia bacterium]
MTSFVTMTVGEETYAVAVASVQELILLQPLTHVPSMPACIRGLMNLRGTVVPVVDLARQLGLGETRIGPLTCVVIVDVSSDGLRSIMGVLANHVRDVVDIDNVERAPAFGSRLPPSYVPGVARLDGQYVLVLDLAKILSADELLAATAAASERS